MSHDRLDDAIDEAVRDMVGAEPPAGLRGRVMRRIAAPQRPPLFTWARLGVAAATAVAITLVLVLGRVDPVTPRSDVVSTRPPIPSAAPPDASASVRPADPTMPPASGRQPTARPGTPGAGAARRGGRPRQRQAG